MRNRGERKFYLRQNLVQWDYWSLFHVKRGHVKVLPQQLQMGVGSEMRRIGLMLHCLRKTPLRFIVRGHLLCMAQLIGGS